MNRFQVIPLLLLLTWPSVQLQAAIVQKDLIEAGDRLLTYDNANQREWLDLPYSLHNRHIIQSQMKDGGVLEDFRFAASEDVEQLMQSADVSEVDGFELPGGPGFGSKKLVDALGYIVHAHGGLLGEFQYTVGQVAAGFHGNEPYFDGTNIVVYSVGMDLSPGAMNRPVGSGSGMGGYFTTPPIELPTGALAGTSDAGPFWLYRNVVPEPSTLSMTLFAGGAALCLRRSLPKLVNARI